MRRGGSWTLGLTVPLALAGGCFGPFSLLQVNSNLDDKTNFIPNSTAFAFVDSHQTVDGGYGTVDVKDRAEPRVSVVVSAARFNPETDLAGLPPNELADLVQLIRRNDLVILTDIPASRLTSGAVLQSSRPSGTADEFTFVLQRGNVGFTRNTSYAQVPPLGARQSVTLQVSTVDLATLTGRLEFTPITVTLARGTAQPTGTPASSGTVTIRANLPVISERLGESNLAVVQAALREP